MKRALDGFFAPQPLLRLEFLRVLLPLAILGFLAARLCHADAWLTTRGFQVPDLGRKDWRQPLYLAPLPPWAAWALAALTVISGLMLSAGLRARTAAGVFAACLVYLALADRLEAFTVSKLGPVLALALACTPCGRAFSFDSLKNSLRGAPRQPEGGPEPAQAGRGAPASVCFVTWGNVRFFQILIVTLYFGSGLAKLRGDWLIHPYVLWTHLHDSYQTAATFWIARHLPIALWHPLQYLVLIFELGAPLWFALPVTRIPALGVGLGIHLFIGVCFGPVKWFALLMAALLIGCFAPVPPPCRFDAAARQ